MAGMLARLMECWQRGLEGGLAYSIVAPKSDALSPLARYHLSTIDWLARKNQAHFALCQTQTGKARSRDCPYDLDEVISSVRCA